MQMAGLFLTFSRACWLAAAVVIPLSTVKRKPKTTVFAILVILITLLVLPAGRERIKQSLSPTEWSSGRVELWSVGLEYAAKSPVYGFGIGSFKSLITLDMRETFPDRGVGDWHNQYLQIFIENGIIGLLAFLWFVFEFYRGCIKILKKTEDRTALGAAAGGCAFITGFLIISMFDTTLNSPYVNTSFWCLAGIIIGWLHYENSMRSA